VVQKRPPGIQKVLSSAVELLAKTAGELCGTSKTRDIVDAAVVASAARRGDAILTSDSRDLRRLASHAPAVEIVKL
jgi:predicted nucleic acid-binding protein